MSYFVLDWANKRSYNVRFARVEAVREVGKRREIS